MAQFTSYGRLFKSSEPVQLTEEETEYNIVAIKHVFPHHTVLQFQCTNTVQEQVLEDVSVSVDLTDAVRMSPFFRSQLHATIGAFLSSSKQSFLVTTQFLLYGIVTDVQWAHCNLHCNGRSGRNEARIPCCKDFMVYCHSISMIQFSFL